MPLNEAIISKICIILYWKWLRINKNKFEAIKNNCILKYMEFWHFILNACILGGMPLRMQVQIIFSYSQFWLLNLVFKSDQLLYDDIELMFWSLLHQNMLKKRIQEPAFWEAYDHIMGGKCVFLQLNLLRWLDCLPTS